MNSLVSRAHYKLNTIISYPLKKKSLKGGLIILNFHQVADAFNQSYHINGTFTNFTEFKKLIRKINSQYGIYSLKEGVSLLSSGKINNDTIFALTFDDGDISLKESAIPFLTKEKIPASFFINTEYLNNQSTSWVRAYSYLLAINHHIFKENKDLKNIFAEIRNTNQPDRYNKCRLILENTFSNLEEKPKFSLSLDDLKEMDSQLFHFGLHGHQHQRYSMLSNEEQNYDIESNIDILKNFTNYIPFWAIPFGTDKDWNRHTIQLALEKELLIFLHTNGINYAWNEFCLNRIPSDGRYFSALISSFKI